MENTLGNKARCIRCKVEKHKDCFYKIKGSLLKHCKDCHKKGVIKSFKKNPENRINKNKRSLKKYHTKVSYNNPIEDTTGHWVDIKEYEGIYQVSRNGDIRRWKKERNKWGVVKPYEVKNGYLRVNLTLRYKNNHQLVHRIVAYSFLEKPKNKDEVNHINGVKSDNRVENLEWCNRSENMKHAHMNGLRNGITKRKKNGQIDKGNNQ